MQVQNRGNHYAYGLQRDRLGNSASDAGGTRGAQTEAANQAAKLGAQVQTATQPAETTAAAKPSDQKQEGAGVVQKVQEGHFQGVANVRLLINFQQQIQLSSSRQAAEALQAGSNDLLSRLGQRLASLDEGFQGISEGVGFGGEVDSRMFSLTSTIEGFFAVSNDSAFDPLDVLSEMQTAFQNFFGSLRPPVVSEPAVDDAAMEDQVVDGAIAAAEDIAATDDLAAGETVVDEDAAAEGTVAPMEESVAESSETQITQEVGGDKAVVAAAEEVSGEEAVAAQETGTEDTQLARSFTAAMQELQSWFDTQWESLRSTIDEMMAMPDLSQPRGNGVAYSRFLAIYSEMNGETASGDASDGSLNSGGIVTQA